MVAATDLKSVPRKGVPVRFRLRLLMEDIVNRIKMLIGFGLSEQEIHDKLADLNLPEDEFFLYYKAAVVSCNNHQ